MYHVVMLKMKCMRIPPIVAWALGEPWASGIIWENSGSQARHCFMMVACISLPSRHAFSSQFSLLPPQSSRCPPYKIALLPPQSAIVFLLPSIGSPQMLLPHPSVLFPLPSMRHTRSHQLTCYRKALRDTAAPGVI